MNEVRALEACARICIICIGAYNTNTCPDEGFGGVCIGMGTAMRIGMDTGTRVGMGMGASMRVSMACVYTCAQIS